MVKSQNFSIFDQFWLKVMSFGKTFLEYCCFYAGDREMTQSADTATTALEIDSRNVQTHELNSIYFLPMYNGHCDNNNYGFSEKFVLFF